MPQNLVSSVPGIFSALLGLVQTAAAAQNPAPSVFPFELGQYEPGQYVTVHEITGPQGQGPGPVYEWESMGSFSQKEIYGIKGCATVYSGDSPATTSSVATTVLQQTINLFQTCVMTPVMSHRTMPYFGTTGPSPYLMLPAAMGYEAHPGYMGGEPSGWVGIYEWSFHFEAVITPA